MFSYRVNVPRLSQIFIFIVKYLVLVMWTEDESEPSNTNQRVILISHHAIAITCHLFENEEDKTFGFKRKNGILHKTHILGQIAERFFFFFW